MFRFGRIGIRRGCVQLRKRLSTGGGGGTAKSADAAAGPSSGSSSTSGAGGGGGFGKALLYGLGLTGIAGTSAVGYAYYDPEFRKKQEETFPFLQSVFQQMLGDPRDTSVSVIPESVSGLKDKVSSYLPKRKEKDAIESRGEISSDDTPVPSLLPKKQTEQKSESELAKEKDKETKRSITREDEQKRRANQQLDKNVEVCVTNAQKVVKAAMEAKNAAATAIDHHTKLLKQAMEDPKDPHWKSVEEASRSVEYALKEDGNKEKAARAELEKLRKVINDGRSGKLTADNPVLVNASETVNQLAYDIDDGISKVKHAQTESKIMTEFKALVEQGREQFSKELSSILPNVDIHAKGTKLSEEELNALIAHAHIRMDQLRRQLTEQQLRESQHVEQALDRQRAELHKATEEKIDLELRKARAEHDVALETNLQEQGKKFEDELRGQLRRSAAAHSEHLEEVLKIQREQMEMGCVRKTEEAVQKERELFHNQVASSFARLQGIENALDSRAAQDVENRKAKELWLACQNLCESVVHGRKSGYDLETRKKPLANELMAIKETSGGDPFVNTMVKAFSDEAVSAGVYTEDDLKSRFWKVRRLCRRTALIGDNGGTVWQYFVSFVQSLFMFDVYKKYGMDEEVDPEKVDTFSVFSRANYFISKEDFATAIRLMLLLKGEPGRLAKDWIRDARVHLETRQAAELLLAHAAATSVRTVY